MRNAAEGAIDVAKRRAVRPAPRASLGDATRVSAHTHTHTTDVIRNPFAAARFIGRRRPSGTASDCDNESSFPFASLARRHRHLR